VDMDRAPDGSVQFIVPDFRLAANSYGHVQFNYDLGATLGPQLFGVTMLDPTTGKELTSRTDLSGAWDISDGQEPNSPFEARYNPIPNAATTPLTTDSRIPNLPTNPAGCSSSNDTCAGLDRVYVDVLASGHISYAGDVDWFRVKGVKAGTRLTADLTNLPLDADLVLYGPATLAASPSLFPKNAVGLPGQLIEDPGLAIGQSASSLAVSALAGLRLDQGYTEPSSGGVFAALTPLSMSQHRGTRTKRAAPSRPWMATMSSR
ncbi:MAG TPA: PPC domain-containing protein, partial [Phycicoccus sp.]|nr:PPC domain-containing protein [Phycicoccus sp.]